MLLGANNLFGGGKQASTPTQSRTNSFNTTAKPVQPIPKPVAGPGAGYPGVSGPAPTACPY
jgi:hypothetical protein